MTALTNPTPAQAVTLDTLEDIIVAAFSEHNLTPSQITYYGVARVRGEVVARHACAIGAAFLTLNGEAHGNGTAMIATLARQTGIEQMTWIGVDAGFTCYDPDPDDPFAEPDDAPRWDDDTAYGRGRNIGRRIARRVLD